MSDSKQKVRDDLLSGKIPERVLIQLTFSLEAACGLAGIDLIKAHFDPETKRKAYHALCDTFYSDTVPLENGRWPEVYSPLGARNWIMGSSGAMQHPEVEAMSADDYEDYINDPMGTIVDKILPAIYTNLDPKVPGASLRLAKAYGRFLKTAGEEAAFFAELTEKHGYAQGFFVRLLSEPPFDFLSDQLRGFKNITLDIRRCPDLVEKACEVTLPLMIKSAIPRGGMPGGIVFLPLHLAPYLRPSDFERFYWPTFEKLVLAIHEAGMKSFIFCEEDWSRFVPFLDRLPALQIIKFEYGDPGMIKETVGKKHIIGGFFDPTITLTRSKEDCIDEVKRLLEIGMPGGKFHFSFDKHVLDIKSVDVSKLVSVIEYVRDNGVY